MEYVLKDLGSYRLHLIKTNKFKTISVRCVFGSPIVKEEITLRNVLCDLFMQSTKNYPDKRSMTIKAQDLYASEYATSNTRLGNYINTNFYMSVLNDKYTEKGNFNEAVKFLSEIIFNPDVSDNKFNDQKLDIVKSNCLSSLNSIKEDATNYSLIRMFESLDENSPSGYRLQGYVEDLDSINSSNLYTYYKNMIKSNLIDIFVVGDFSVTDMVEVFKEKFSLKILKKRRVPYLVEEGREHKKINIVKEEILNTQSKLAIACRIKKLSDYERHYPLTLFNIIFGGGSDSKLFQSVREKNSYCYTIYSATNKLDSLLIIQAGIDRVNYKCTVDLIEKELNNMRKGRFDLKDINIAKEYYETAVQEVEDSQDRIIDNYLAMKLLGNDPIDVRLSKMKMVTKEEIVKVSKKVHMDTIFLLEGVKDERD